MKLPFCKYQATGNDFVIIDNRERNLAFTTAQIQRMCDRKFGIGADGLMLLENDSTSDFNLQYFNSDGSQSLCGNGSRAAVSFASMIGMVNGKTRFNAYDGLHEAELLSSDMVKLQMGDVAQGRNVNNDQFLHTGSPHYIRFVENLDSLSVIDQGRAIRYSDAFQPGGTNVNFVQLLGDNTIYVRTYERGVEDETLSCGTGVTAAALAAFQRGYSSPVRIKTRGGDLSVEFKASHTGTFTEIYLIGPAKMVFKGELEL